MEKLKKYTGQKDIPGLIQKIINQIPPHDTIVELFAGSAAVSRKLSVLANSKIILNDIDLTVTSEYPIPGATIINRDALDLIQSISATLERSETFVFVDPPYLHETRSNNSLYPHEMTNIQHLSLLESLLPMNCKIMIIHPSCEMYNQMLCEWRKVEIKVRYNGKTSIENLYMNYPQPELLQTYRYVGSDCWERQRIKRKGDRMIRKLQALPEIEKNYLLNRIQEELIITN